jgi:CheY-like chemotaxis protein
MFKKLLNKLSSTSKEKPSTPIQEKPSKPIQEKPSKPIQETQIDDVFEPRVNKGVFKLLIVDDAKINRYVLRRFIGKIVEVSQIEISESEDGLDVLEKVKTTDFNIIFLDIKMPKMNGDQVAIELRKMGFKNIIIGVTGQIEAKEIVLQNGMDEVIEKPVDINVLKRIFTKYIDSSVVLKN